jgi:hypothetical protein
MSAHIFALPSSRCPQCGNLLEVCGSNSISSPPNVGDLTLCVHCAELLEFGEGLRIQALNPQRLSQIQAESPDTYAELMQRQKAVQG